MDTTTLKFGTFFWRITSAHMITYFLMGLIAVTALNYKETFDTPPLSYLMKPVDSPWVAAGPILQILRGLVLAIALWPFRSNIIHAEFGWLKLWLLLFCLCVLSTSGPAPGSIEGMIYTKIPIVTQLSGYIEVMPQTLLMSLIVYFWYERPGRAWNIVTIALVSIIVVLCVAALTLPR